VVLAAEVQVVEDHQEVGRYFKNMKYIFATGNENKLKEAKSILGEDVESIKIDLFEIQDLDPLTVVIHKAKEAYEKLGISVLIEDTSLMIGSMNGLPGPFIKWFLETVKNEGIIKMTDPVDRKAKAVCYVALFDGESIVYGKGETEGSISVEERGQGFGWDPIFIPNGSDKTFGQMSLEEKNLFSMRKKAFQDFSHKQQLGDVVK
jgi:non-canonical purine NTP pyrophosphatase (RdgB/HAM1 family)